jgi:hypothetical protein
MRWCAAVVPFLLLSSQANAAECQTSQLVELGVSMSLEARAALYVSEANTCLFMCGLSEISDIRIPDRAVSNAISACKAYLDRSMLSSYGGDYLLHPLVKVFRTFIRLTLIA